MRAIFNLISKQNIAVAVSVGIFFISTPQLFAWTGISNGGNEARWPGGHASYQFSTNTSGYFTGPGGHDVSGVGATNEYDPIRTAFSTWTSLGGVALSVTETGFTSATATSTDGQNTITWITSGWKTLSFQPPSNALGVTLLAFNASTGALTNADIYFNAQYFAWSDIDSDPPPASEANYIDVQNIATHEIGHFWGLDHSSNSFAESDPTLKSATMYYASGAGDISRRTLHQDDINAITHLYGTATPATPTITSIEMTSSSSTTNVFTVKGSNFSATTSFVLTLNTNAVADSVSRYKTIVSPNEASVQFDVETFPSGSANIIVANSPDVRASASTIVVGGALASTDSGGGGGCELSLEDRGTSFVWMLISGLTFLLLFFRRFSLVRLADTKYKRKI